MFNGFRAFAWRMGRKLYFWGRGEQHNSPEANGEYWLLAEVVRLSSQHAHFMDIGANKGDWTIEALKLSEETGKSVNLHAFEPCTGTRQMLEARLPEGAGARVNALAMSSTPGETEFYSSGAGLGTNSLNQVSGTEVERVQVSTIDAYLESNGINRVELVKVDTEGFDLEVLRGAERALSEGKIALIQFEYNWRWLLNRASLLQVFQLIAGTPYRFGRLVNGGIKIYEQWHFELDRYFEGNYVLIHVDFVLNESCSRVEFDQHNVGI